MRLAICFSIALSAWAQTTFTVSGPANVRGGTQAFIGVDVLLSASNNVAAYQFDIAWPAGWTVDKALPGSATANAGKTLTCRTDYTRCIAWGINSNTIAAGVLVAFTVRAPASTPAGTGPSINVTNVIASTLEGTTALTTTGPAWTPNFFARQDVNGDGAINVLDVQSLLPYVLGSNPSSCPVEQDADGFCTVLDIQIVARAALAAAP